MDDFNFFGDTKALRRSMFICQHDRSDHIRGARLKELGWRDRRPGNLTGIGSDCVGVPLENGFPNSCHKVLSNSDVLEHVAIHLPNQDLKNCRLVCKFWCIELATLFSKRKSLVVTDNQCSNSYKILKKRQTGHPTSLYKLAMFDVDPSCVLYKKLFSTFGLTLSVVNFEDCSLSPSDLVKMFTVDSPNIENFHYREEYTTCKRILPKKANFFWQMKELNGGNLSLPKIKFLHWDELNGQTELQDIITACPNLVHLELRNFPLPRPEEYKTLRCDSLRNMFLSPDNALKSEHCAALKYLNLKLESFTLFGINTRDKIAIKRLQEFLASLAGTLKTLELWLDYGSVIYDGRQHFSPMTVSLPNLVRLHTEAEVLGHVNNLRHLTDLKDLEIVSNHEEGHDWNALTRRITIKTKLEKLQSFRCGQIDCQSLSKMMKVFPSITTLNIYASSVSDKLLRAVFSSLTMLSDLTISPCMKSQVLMVSDSGFTGIKEEKCSKIVKNMNKYTEQEMLDMQTFPDISKLQCLTKLDLGFSISRKITDLSVIFGISRLKKLSILKFPVCGISDLSVSLIHQELKNLYILGIGGCEQVSSKAIVDFKERRSGVLVDVSLPEFVTEKL